MRTLICEFQPFHAYTSDGMVEVNLEDVYRSGTQYGRIRVPIHNTGRQGGSPGRHYHYAYIGSKEVKRGDWALVHNGSEFGICEIKRVVPGIDPKVTKHVIEVLTQDEFKAYVERNQKIDELRNVMDELDYRLDQHKKLDKYRDLAKTDPRAAELLKQVADGLGIKVAEIEAQAQPAE